MARSDDPRCARPNRLWRIERLQPRATSRSGCRLGQAAATASFHHMTRSMPAIQDLPCPAGRAFLRDRSGAGLRGCAQRPTAVSSSSLQTPGPNRPTPSAVARTICLSSLATPFNKEQPASPTSTGDTRRPSSIQSVGRWYEPAWASTLACNRPAHWTTTPRSSTWVKPRVRRGAHEDKPRANVIGGHTFESITVGSSVDVV